MITACSERLRRAPFWLTLLCVSACASAHGRFEQNRFQHESYPYAVWYSEGASAADIIGPNWRVDNYYARDERSSGMSAKTGPEYEVHRAYDLNGDGSYEAERDEPFYDLLLKHRHKDASLWVRSIPIERADVAKDLSVFADRYLAAVAGAGSVVVRFGVDGPVGLVEKRFAAQKLASAACSVTGKPAWRLDFEVANVDDLQLSAAAGRSRGALIIARPGYETELFSASGAKATYPVLILIGLSAQPQDAAELEPDLDRLLSQLVLSDRGQGLPLHGKHTCQVAPPSAGGEMPVPLSPPP